VPTRIQGMYESGKCDNFESGGETGVCVCAREGFLCFSAAGIAESLAVRETRNTAPKAEVQAARLPDSKCSAMDEMQD